MSSYELTISNQVFGISSGFNNIQNSLRDTEHKYAPVAAAASNAVGVSAGLVDTLGAYAAEALAHPQIYEDVGKALGYLGGGIAVATAAKRLNASSVDVGVGMVQAPR